MRSTCVRGLHRRTLSHQTGWRGLESNLLSRQLDEGLEGVKLSSWLWVGVTHRHTSSSHFDPIGTAEIGTAVVDGAVGDLGTISSINGASVGGRSLIWCSTLPANHQEKTASQH